MRFHTKAVHAGQQPEEKTGAVVPPIFQNVTHQMSEPGVHAGFDYLRTVNPTRSSLEECLASLEGAQYCTSFSSGMAAVAAVCHLLQPGDHLVASLHIYAGTHRYLTAILPRMGVEVTFAATESVESVAEALRDNTRMIWVETPSNPLISLSDIRAISELAAKSQPRPIVLVDSTLASPYCQKPLELGADAVLHSTTKYISGHLDVLGGAVMTSRGEIHKALFDFQNTSGPTPSPFDNWLTLRGVRTLGIRMQQCQNSAQAIAEYFDASSDIEWTRYPGLPSHPQYELAKRQMTGYSGMVTACVKGGLERTAAFVKALKVITLAESLGGVQSLISHSATMTHASLSPEEKDVQGITDGVVRLSVGIEDAEDLLEDIEQALRAS